MRLRILTGSVAACGVLAGSASAVTPVTPTLSHGGFGFVKIGMTVKQVEAAAGTQLEFGSGQRLSCRTAELADGIGVLFAGSRLARIYVTTSTFATTKGIRIGAREAGVLRAYGTVTRSRHTYVRGGEYLKVTLGRKRLVFETSRGGKVTQMSSGRVPQVDYVEGCA